jgi:hypothetical protein
VSTARRRFAALAIGAGLLLAGCAAPGQVKAYNEQVEENFVSKCVEANDAKGPNPESTCKCWYTKITEQYSFDEFKRLDADLKQAVEDEKIKSSADLKAQFPKYYELITTTCQQSGVSAN